MNQQNVIEIVRNLAQDPNPPESLRPLLDRYKTAVSKRQAAESNVKHQAIALKNAEDELQRCFGGENLVLEMLMEVHAATTQLSN